MELTAPGPAARPTSRARVEYRLFAGVLLIAALILAVWFALSGSFLVAKPLPTLGLLLDGLFGQGWMLPHIAATFRPVLIGFVIAAASGVGVGIFLGGHRYWRTVFEPILLVMYSIPKITLFPVFLLLWGTGVETRIVMAFIHAVFPLILNSMVGVSTVSPVHLRVARMVRASPWQTTVLIYFPSMAPALVAGVRMGFSLAIVGVVLSELFAAREGLGLLIVRSYGQLNLERMFAVIIFLFLVALLVNVSLWGLEKRLRAHA